MDTTFERLMLADSVKEARNLGAKIRQAWVHQTGRTWEFVYGDFHWCGQCANAYDARAQGWEAWVSKQNERKS